MSCSQLEDPKTLWSEMPTLIWAVCALPPPVHAHSWLPMDSVPAGLGPPQSDRCPLGSCHLWCLPHTAPSAAPPSTTPSAVPPAWRGPRPQRPHRLLLLAALQAADHQVGVEHGLETARALRPAVAQGLRAAVGAPVAHGAQRARAQPPSAAVDAVDTDHAGPAGAPRPPAMPPPALGPDGPDGPRTAPPTAGASGPARARPGSPPTHRARGGGGAVGSAALREREGAADGEGGRGLGAGTAQNGGVRQRRGPRRAALGAEPQGPAAARAGRCAAMGLVAVAPGSPSPSSAKEGRPCRVCSSLLARQGGGTRGGGGRNSSPRPLLPAPSQDRPRRRDGAEWRQPWNRTSLGQLTQPKIAQRPEAIPQLTYTHPSLQTYTPANQITNPHSPPTHRHCKLRCTSQNLVLNSYNPCSS